MKRDRERREEKKFKFMIRIEFSFSRSLYILTTNLKTKQFFNRKQISLL